MDKILLLGDGGHARSCIDVIESTNQYQIVGMVEKNKSMTNANLGYPIIGTDVDLTELRQKYNHALITVGQIKSPETRMKLFILLIELDFSLPVVISPKAYVSKHAQIGEGSIVMHGAIVNANVKIGKNCIINNNTLIEHDVVIGDHCHIATGAIINGEVSIGDKTFVGSGVVTKQGISIGENCVIGAGAIIKSNIKSNQIVNN